MFNEYELEQIEKAFIYSKERFEIFDDFYNNKIEKVKDKKTWSTYLFITIARFINYKEDIWIKDKKTKNITTRFSREILDDFIFKGKFTSTKIAFREDKKRSIFDFDPVQIAKIFKGKENDSVWIIDNIRDSIAHGHFYIDFDNQKIFIKNNHEDRLLHCSINFELFFVLNELITEERIGGYSDRQLTTPPILYREHYNTPNTLSSIKNEQELHYLLQNGFVALYCKVIDSKETDENKKYKDLTDFYNYNLRLVQKFFNKYQGSKSIDIMKIYKKDIQNYINTKMKNYTIEIHSEHIDSNTTKKIIEYIKEQPSFYTRDLYHQGLILHEILKSVISNEKITIERGVMEFAELYSLNALRYTETNKKRLDEIDGLIFSNVNSFKENKKLASLFILGINNFVCYKESIYDKYFDDYNEFDISNFDYQDYSAYNKLFKSLTVKNDDLRNTNNTLIKNIESKNKLKSNLDKAPDDKKQIIQNNINKVDNLINDVNDKINNLTHEILNINNLIDSHETDSNGNYVNNNNKSFFNHLRNAFAHNNVSYLDDRIVYNRKILLEDYDDNGILTFRCTCRYYDLVKLFNDNLFLNAITNTKEKNKVLKK